MDVVNAIARRIKLEPAVVAGLLGAIAVALTSAASWTAAVPLIVGAIIRFLVVPTAALDELEELPPAELNALKNK